MQIAQSDYRVADSSGVAVPCRRQILEYLSEAAQPVTPKSLYAVFELTDAVAQQALDSRLARLQQQGIIIPQRGGFNLPAGGNIIYGRVVGRARGGGFIVPEDGSEDLHLHLHQMRRLLHGDRVLAKVGASDHRGRKQTIIIEVCIDKTRRIVGRYYVHHGVGVVEPEDARFACRINIPPAHQGEASPDDVVSIEIIQHPVRAGEAHGKVVEVVGQWTDCDMPVEIAIRKHDLPHTWSKAVRAEIARLDLTGVDNSAAAARRDIRHIPLVTIDAQDAKDLDDAVYAAPHKRGWRLLVAIADVSHYVQPASQLDQAAFERGNSVYFPTRVLPMLPEELSNGACSLNPHTDRYCLVCEMQLDAQAHITEFEFYPGIMHSQARLTYTRAAQLSEQPNCSEPSEEKIVPTVLTLQAVAHARRELRRQAGCIEFDFDEAQVVFDQQQRVQDIRVQVRNSAYGLIEECMLAANVCAAKLLHKHFGDQTIYRNHAGPTPTSLRELRQLLSGLGLTLHGGDKPEAKHYADLLAQQGQRDQHVDALQLALLRSLSQAEYACEPNGHFALAFPLYTHFTSPIRRYTDLLVHRLIRQGLARAAAVPQSRAKTEPPVAIVPLDKVAAHCSRSERRAETASREVLARLKAEFMQDKLGQDFSAKVSSVREFGIFVTLQEVFVDGLIHVSELGNDYFHFNPNRLELVGERTAQRYCLGDILRVRVSRVDLTQAQVDFVLAAPHSRRPRGKSLKPRSH